MSDDPLLSISGLHKYFTQNDGSIDRLLGADEMVRIVNGVSSDVERGEMLGFVGESGSGKSTTARSVLRLDEPTKGTVSYDGTDLTALSDQEITEIRKRIQVVFQDPASSLNRRKTAGQIIRQPMEIHSLYGGERDARVDELMETVGLPPRYSNRYPHELSGGQCQRAGIVHALAVDPDFIVVDEPVSALDVSIQAQTLNLLDDLQKEFDLTLLFVAHDFSVIRHVCDRVAVIYLGEIVELTDADELFPNPQHLYTWALLGTIPQPMPEPARQRQVFKGKMLSPLDPSSGCSFSPRCSAATEECASVDPTLDDMADATGSHKAVYIYVDEFKTGAGVPSAAQGVDERFSIENFDAEPTLVTGDRGDDDR